MHLMYNFALALPLSPLKSSTFLEFLMSSPPKKTPDYKFYTNKSAIKKMKGQIY